MTIYQFKSVDGEMFERDYPMASAPKIGKAIRVSGKTYWRVPSGSTNAIVKEYRHVGWTLPRASRDPYIAKVAPGLDSHGRVVCESRREVLNLQAKLKASPGHSRYVWDQD